MTQIKLRRDTSSAFASSNPILGNGEPAYETDTKKLKIGDGTTAYTQLEYFSAGGGGSTNISATLPLKIIDGVISLEVDGQTIQIVDGKLHANLDELGNEVNSLTGEVTDLSGRVTTVESDVLQKQNTIIANSPLQLTESSSIELQSNELSYDNTTGILSYASGARGDVMARIDLSRLHIKTHEPYTLHLRAARAQTTATGNSNFFRLQCYNDGTDTTFRGVRVWNGGGTGRAGGTNTVAKALILNSTDYVHYEFRYDGTNGISEYRGRNNDTTDATRLNINTFTDQAGDYSKFENEFTQLLLNCYYGYAGKFDLSQSYIEQNNVRYILKDVVADGISTLRLNIGNGLSVTDGKLTASSTAPSNMVTTDTTQTISGLKTFSAGIKGNGYIKNIGLTDLVYTDTNTNPHVGNVNRTLTIHTNPIGNGRILVNTGSSNYEDLHTGNIANFIDGTSITFTNNKLSATGGSSSANIPLVFGMSQYYKGEMNNVSWLKSEGQQNAKALYPDFYAWVLEKANASTDGFKLSTATDITDYDFVINTTDETFRLPLKNGQENLPDYSDNQVSLPMPFPKPYVAPSDGYLVGGLTAGIANTTLSINGRPAGITNKGDDNFQGSVVVNIAVKKGDVITIDDYFRDDLYFIPLQGNGNLYYYCGNTTQNETLINVGEITNALAGKLDIPVRYPVEVSDKSLMPSWYVVYNDGWCEQGGIMTGSGTGARVTLTYLKPYINTWFYFNSKTLSSYTGAWTGNFESINNVTTNSINIWGGASGEYTYWYSSGYVS